MKKRFAMLMALILALCGLSALAEGGDDPVAPYLGEWVAGRALLTIEAGEDGAVFCTVNWGSSYAESAVWEYEATYDEVADELNTLETGVKSIVTYAEGGEIVSSEVEFDDGAAAFKLNDDGTLTWTDYKQTPGENEVLFERVEYYDELVDDEADEADEADGSPDLRRLRLGSSGYTVMIGNDFVAGDLTEADVAEGKLGCYQDDETGLDLDVIRIPKADSELALSHFTLRQADAEEKVEVVWPTDQINDVDVGWYWGWRERDGEDCEVAVYIADGADAFVELVLWTPDEAAAIQATEIAYSLQRMETKEIPVGESAFTLAVPADYQLGEISDEDVADDQVAYWYSDASLLDFDVYQFGKEGQPATIAEYAAAEAATYPEVSELVTDGEINGIPVAWYRAVDECEEGEYDTITYIFESGDEYFEIVFWLDGPTAGAEADFIIQSLTDGSASGQDN